MTEPARGPFFLFFFKFRDGLFLIKPTRDSYKYYLPYLFFFIICYEQQKEPARESVHCCTHSLLGEPKWKVKLKLEMCLMNIILDHKKLKGGVYYPNASISAVGIDLPKKTAI